MSDSWISSYIIIYVHILYLVTLVTVFFSETVMFTKVFKIILCHAVLVILLMFFKDICRFSLKSMSMSLIKIYQTHTTTNERLPTEQQNGYHGIATEQFIEGDTHILVFSRMEMDINGQARNISSTSPNHSTSPLCPRILGPII